MGLGLELGLGFGLELGLGFRFGLGLVLVHLQRGHELDPRIVARVDRLDGLEDVDPYRLLAEDLYTARRLTLVSSRPVRDLLVRS